MTERQNKNTIQSMQQQQQKQRTKHLPINTAISQSHATPRENLLATAAAVRAAKRLLCLASSNNSFMLSLDCFLQSVAITKAL